MDLKGYPRRAIFIVNEYGEFGELLQVARLLKERLDLEGTFVFGRDDYGRLDDHKSIAAAFGFDGMALSRTELAELRWHLRRDERARSGNYPDMKPGKLSSMRRLLSFFFVLASHVFALALALPTLALGVLLLPVVLVQLLVARIRRYKDRHRVFGILGVRLLIEGTSFARNWRRLARWKGHARALLRELDPEIIIMGQDYPGSYNSIISRLAKRKKIQSVVVPFGMYSARELAKSLFRYPQNILPHGPFYGLFRLLYPQWVYNYRGRHLLRLPLGEIMALELHGLGWRDPWKPLTSPVYLLCQSPQALEYYGALGKPNELMRLTGSVWNDLIYERLQSCALDRNKFRRSIELLANLPQVRARLVEECGEEIPQIPVAALERLKLPQALTILETIEADFRERTAALAAIAEKRAALGAVSRSEWISRLMDFKIDETRSIIVIAWPANQYPARPMPGVPTYEALTEALIASLSLPLLTQRFDVWVSVHPTLWGVIDPAVFERAGLRLVRRPLIEFIHCADLFVATVSSTLLWAVQCRIPAINFDCYLYKYPEFPLMGCRSVTTFAELERELAAVSLSDGAFPEQAHLDQRVGYWTMSDGASRTRIVSAIQCLLIKNTVARS